MAEPMVPGVTGTLDDSAVAALTGWVRAQGLGTQVSDVVPLAGGSQNVVVRLSIDGRRMVLRRPPPHPRPNSDRTMQREIAVLQTLAGSAVPHPEIIAACEDLNVLGVIFYLMDEVDGFNPGNEIAPAYVESASMRHDVGLHYAAAVARLGQAAWQGSPLEEWKRPGSFLERQVPQWRNAVAAYRQQDGYAHDSLPGVDELCDWLEANRPADYVPGIVHGDIHLNNTMLRREVPEAAAFVDWEMCTIGDPLLDLGWMLVCWPIAPDPLGSAGYLAELGGLASRTEPRRRDCAQSAFVDQRSLWAQSRCSISTLGLARALLVGGHRTHDLLGMLAAAVPGGLVAARALDLVAHGFFSFEVARLRADGVRGSDLGPGRVPLGVSLFQCYYTPIGIHWKDSDARTSRPERRRTAEPAGRP